VVCQAGSAMPRYKAARHQYVLELVGMGVLKDPHKIQEMLELGYGEPDDVDKAIAQANRENQMMMQGSSMATTRPEGQEDDSDEEEQSVTTAVAVKAWHNHAIHIQRHGSVMMDEEFDRLSVTRPEIVRLFDEHMAMHSAELQKQQMAMQQQLLAAKGAPDGPPGNSGGEVPQSPNGDQPMPDGSGTGASAPSGMIP